MNSSGWLRTIMAVHYDEEKFLRTILDTMSKEFVKEILILEIIKGNYLISFGEYSLVISKELISTIKGPRGQYRLDRYILEGIYDSSSIKEKSVYTVCVWDFLND